jgi:RNA polymerase sigma-70 factor, ECF subfamily
VLEHHDEALVEGCRKGDHAAFAILVTRYQRPIYNAAYRVLGNADDAKDITQVVFLKIVEHLNEYDSHYKFFSWIYRITVNESIDLLRRSRREELLYDEIDRPGPDSSSPEWQFSNGQLSARVQRALMSMKIDDRIVLTLRHFSDCSYQEIAHILNLEEKTVKSRLFEARRRLSEMLKDLRPN